MKSFLLSLMVVLMGFSVHAQAAYTAGNESAEGNSGAAAPRKADNASAAKVVYVDRSNPMAGIEMNVADGWASFHNLQGLNGLHLYVTNSSGDVEIDRKISARNNAVEINRLKAGLYFVTIINENTDQRRTFTFNK